MTDEKGLLVHVFVDETKQNQITETNGETYSVAPYAITLDPDGNNLPKGYKWTHFKMLVTNDDDKFDIDALRAGSSFLYNATAGRPSGRPEGFGASSKEDIERRVTSIYDRLKK